MTALVSPSLFQLVPGMLIAVPYNAISAPSINADAFPNTPHAFLLSTEASSGLRYFQEKSETPRSKSGKGFRLFAPKDAKPSNLLVVEWTEPTCACTRLATPAEIAAAKSVSQPQPTA